VLLPIDIDQLQREGAGQLAACRHVARRRAGSRVGWRTASKLALGVGPSHTAVCPNTVTTNQLVSRRPVPSSRSCTR
jgi:hypothetical protein